MKHSRLEQSSEKDRSPVISTRFIEIFANDPNVKKIYLDMTTLYLSRSTKPLSIFRNTGDE